MADLRFDLDAVRDIASDLRTIASEFRDANVGSERIADATGHPGLADAVRSFAHSWDDTREEMLGTIEGLGEATDAIADAFAQTDSDLADVFAEQPAGAAGTRGIPRAV
jgi:hypothetical protein